MKKLIVTYLVENSFEAQEVLAHLYNTSNGELLAEATFEEIMSSEAKELYPEFFSVTE